MISIFWINSQIQDSCFFSGLVLDSHKMVSCVSKKVGVWLLAPPKANKPGWWTGKLASFQRVATGGWREGGHLTKDGLNWPQRVAPAVRQAPPSLGFSRQEHCSGSPFPPPMRACMLSCSVMSSSVWPYGQQPTRLPRPWDSPGKNTAVGWRNPQSP